LTVLTEVVAVIAHEDDGGFFREPEALQFIQHFSRLRVHERRGGAIRAH